MIDYDFIKEWKARQRKRIPIKDRYTSKELMRKFATKQSALDATLENIKWLFDNFEHICVSVSGGKDSSVLWHMCETEAVSRGRKVICLFVDEEFILSSSIDIIKKIMRSPVAIPLWYVLRHKTQNAYSIESGELYTWDATGRKGLFREKPDYEFVRFYDGGEKSFVDCAKKIQALIERDYKNCVFLDGVTSDESLIRLRAKKGVSSLFGKTWLKFKDVCSGSPLVDMAITDIWKYICDFNVEVSELYQKVYKLGEPLSHIRTSSLLHEQTLRTGRVLQEVYADEFSRVADILGCHSISDASDIVKIKLNACHSNYYDMLITLLEILPAKLRDTLYSAFLRKCSDIPNDIKRGDVKNTRSRVLFLSYCFVKIILTSDYTMATMIQKMAKEKYHEFCKKENIEC